MIFRYILTGLASLMFLMIGFDKFFNYLEPPCTLEDKIPAAVWTSFGILQLAAAVLIWLPKLRRPVLAFFTAFMAVFTIVHLINGTQDIGGAVFMTLLLGLLLLNPRFLQSKKELTS